jgi:hypothetical protein
MSVGPNITHCSINQQLYLSQQASTLIPGFPIVASSLENYPAPGGAVAPLAGGLFYNGQGLASVNGGGATALVRFDTTTTSPFTAVDLPQSITAGLATQKYRVLQITGTIPMYLGPTTTNTLYATGRISAEGLLPANVNCPPVTIWMKPDNQPTSFGNTYTFVLTLKVGTHIQTGDTQIQFTLANDDFQGYNPPTQGSTVYIGGSGALSSANVLNYTLI